jgi:hypothetical protein
MNNNKLFKVIDFNSRKKMTISIDCIFKSHFFKCISAKILNILNITKVGQRLTIGNPPSRGSSMKIYFSKEGLILRTFIALVKVLYSEYYILSETV